MGSICPWNSDSGRPKFYCKMRRGSAPISSHYRRDSDPVPDPSQRFTKCEKLFVGCCVLVCFLPIVIGLSLVLKVYVLESLAVGSYVIGLVCITILVIVPIAYKCRKSKQSQEAPATEPAPRTARKPSLWHCEEIERVLQKMQQRQKE
jgi:hypothetical protein